MCMQVNAQILELPALFKSLIKKLTQEWKNSVADKLSMSQFRMLYMLQNKGLSRPNELADALSVTPGAITGMADKLIHKGYIARTRDKEDRRVIHLVITEKGIGYVDEMLEKQKESILAVFDRLPEEDIAHLMRIFRFLLESMETEEE